MIKRVKSLDEVIDFAWELSQNDLYASYHRLRSLEKVKEYIERAINSNIERIIASYRKDKLCGLCIYFWNLEEKYAQTTMFLIKEDYDEVADELIAYIGNHLPGYELFIGLPFSNVSGNQYFKKKNYKCIDSQIDTRLYNLQPHINLKHHMVEEITKDNFEEYERFHDKYAIPLEMYYNNKNLKKEIEIFRIYVYKENGVIHASIFVKITKDMTEIFGLFIDDEYKGKNIESILIDEALMQLYKEFGSLKEILYFIDEDSTEELNSALAAGFKINDTYRCYKCEL